MTAASRGQQINTKYKQISKVDHMVLPEIQTKSISLSASAQIRPKKNRCVSANMPKKIRVGRSENLFIFLQIFIQ